MSHSSIGALSRPFAPEEQHGCLSLSLVLADIVYTAHPLACHMATACGEMGCNLRNSSNINWDARA